MIDKRTEMLKAAVAAVLKEHKAVNVKNVKRLLPEDFFMDFDTGQMLDSNVIYAEIQAAQAAVPHMPPIIKTLPNGTALADLPPVDDSEFLGEAPTDELLETVEPVSEAAPAATDDDVTDGGNVRPLSPQARLAAAREREHELVGLIPVLKAKQREASAAVAAAIRAFQELDPDRQTPETLRREFIANSNREREARSRGEVWATRPARERPGRMSPLDSERFYSQGGDANSFARRMARTGSARGAFTKREATMRGFVNTDPRRGPVLVPPAEPKPTIPALAGK